jgi:nuclear pore complex protein Nup98-Nup96
MPSQDARWHDNFKPSFANNGVFTYSVPGPAPPPSGELAPAIQGFVGERYDVRFSVFVPAADINATPLDAQKVATAIDVSGGFPAARPPKDILFSELAAEVASDSDHVVREDSIWKLCSILFDPLDVACPDYMQGIPADKIDNFADRMRLDALAAFWSRLVAPYVQDGLRRARTTEEKVIHYLTKNDIVAACEALMDAKDFKLATLVAQLPASERSRAMMKDQINAWRNRNDWSEMSDPVRALYTILAGEVSVVEGKVDAPENRVADFTISERFELSWQQSFALKLFYRGHETIKDVIEDYEAAAKAGRETKKPATTWANGKVTSDVLFELLSLSAKTKPKAVFDPLTVSGSAVNSRLAWQLSSLLNKRQICTTAQEQLDQLSYGFAMELENAGDIVNSVWALLHIVDAGARTKAVQASLRRFGGKISTPGLDVENTTFQQLTQENRIPAAYLWTAKALYANAGLRNPALQTDWLLKAGDIDAAHEVLCTTLGPQAVIQQDYAVLSHVLSVFPRRLPDGWQCGGQVYLDFVRLVHARTKQRLSPEDEGAMKRLRRGLAEMEEDPARQSQVERVAVIEMGKVLDDVAREHNDGGKDKKMGGMDLEGVSSLGAQMLRRYQEAMGVGA